MKAQKLDDGYYFVEKAEIKTEDKKGNIKSLTIRNTVIHKIGNQVNYFNTKFFDYADTVDGVFYKLTQKQIKDNLEKIR